MRWMVVAVALAGCVPVVVEEPVAGSCGAGALQGLVGLDAAALQTMRFSQPVRVIRPGMAVTMDYQDGRLNIEVDGSERISRVSCG